MPDGVNEKRVDLAKRLTKDLPPLAEAAHEVIRGLELPNPPVKPGPRTGFTISFFARMVFSCLVDADFLDTEAFLSPQDAGARVAGPDISRLCTSLERYLKGLRAKSKKTPLNQQRNLILDACQDSAKEPPGIYSLTVPTGGGKTISSLAFALAHARAHQMKRIIYTIPFTSIIEQNAAVFRDILGHEAVLEHHSNLPVPDKDDTENYERYLRARLAAQNWDAPVVVTTNVQFFESLFANRPSKCRKLHNIARSVIILDEAQMLPRQVLLPCLEALRELAVNYGCTVVLCTATQPTLNNAETFKKYRLEPREIAPEPEALYEDFRRVKVIVEPEPLDSSALADRLAQYEQVLCIVNTRRQARELFEALRSRAGAEGIFHLSALMHPQHRSQKLDLIKKALEDGHRCLCVSTQLIEAGVDVDFPVVWRSMAGVDSLAQAAGRCNREGRRPGLGQLHIFEPAQDKGHIPLSLRISIQEGRGVLRQHNDPLSLQAVSMYFDNLFWQQRHNLDEKKVLNSLSDGLRDIQFGFAEAAANFQCFDSPGEAVLVCPEGRERDEIIKGLRHSPHPGEYLRRAQPYMVQLYPFDLKALIAAGDVVRLEEVNLLVLENMALYDDDLGLVTDASEGEVRDPSGLYA
jgi:CRISPR-associated endonuclease/helicase Cas3